MDAKNVSFGKPKISGAIFSAPLGSKLPTDPVMPLDEAFKELGFVSDDGLSNSNSPKSDTIKAWGGATVLVVQKEKADEFTFKLLETTNLEVLKEVYGAMNITGDLKNGITIKANAISSKPHVLVFDLSLQAGVKRIVLPNATIKEISDIEYTDEDAIGYEITVACSPDKEGNTHYEYIKEVG